MKIKYIFLIQTLLFLCFKTILNGCKYITEKGSTEVLDTDSNDYLESAQGDEARQSCYSLSNSKVHTDVCCYNKNTNKCVSKDEDGAECPNLSTEIFNNCGLAGVYQPVTAEICTEISLVQGYCCFVKTEKDGTACIRTRELKKEKNKETNDIIEYINKHNNNSVIKSVQCGSEFLKYYSLMLMLVIIVLF